MARLSSANPPSAAPDPTSINLTRILARLQQILVTPDSETESRLQVSSSERAKVGANLEYARSLLLKLEQDAQNIKIQSRKQDTQSELVGKRDMLQRLNERLQELNEMGEYESRRDDDSSDGEDLLGEDTPSEATDSHASLASPADSIPGAESPRDPQAMQPLEIPPSAPQPESSTRVPESEMRARHKAERAELLTPAATSTGISTATAESLLTQNRTEQENLTDSLLQMARALKGSTNAFSTTLEEEKYTLDSAAKGLDKNELGMEAAQRKIGLLRKLTEGTGFWGRMKMYAFIFGLMVIAILIVFVMPKLRFSPGF